MSSKTLEKHVQISYEKKQTKRKWNWIGRSIARRRENTSVVIGDATFLDDVSPKNTLYAAFVRSTYAHARITNLNLNAALRIPGVIGAYSGKELKKEVNPYFAPTPYELASARRAPLYPLAVDKTTYVGEPIAVVVATDKYIAEDAVEEVSVDYEPLQPVLDAERGMSNDSPKVCDDWPDNILLTYKFENGNLEGAFNQADYVITQKFKEHRYSGTPLEPRGSVAIYSLGTGELTIYSQSQYIHSTASIYSHCLGVAESKVRLINPRAGGGFGVRIGIYPEEIASAYLAIRLHKPIKWIEDRFNDFKGMRHSRETVSYVEAAVMNDGTITAIRAKLIADTGAPYPPAAIPSTLTAAQYVTGPYRIKNYGVELIDVVTNKTPYGPYRGQGKANANYVIERLVDKIADKLNMDHAEIRFRNLISPKEMPYVSATGSIFESGDYPKCLRTALSLANYEETKKLRKNVRSDDSGHYIGIGMSFGIEPTGSTRLYMQSGYEPVSLRMNPTGDVVVFTDMPEHGQGHSTSLAQVVADAVGLNIDDVTVIAGDSASSLYGYGAYSSRFSIVTVSAAFNAGLKLREKLVKIVSHILGAQRESIEIEDSIIKVNGKVAPLRLREVASKAYNAIHLLPGDLLPGLEFTEYYKPPNVTDGSYIPDQKGRFNMFAAYPYAASVAIVDVIPHTGEVKVLKYVCVHDAGNRINPLIVETQDHGCIMQGIGGAMYEEFIYDENGQLLTSTFADYLIPTIKEVPPLVVTSMETPHPNTPLGAKGGGETAIMGPLSAIPAAVEDALRAYGVRLYSTPVTPLKVWSAIRSNLEAEGQR